MTATILDGKATAAEIKDELRTRVKALAERSDLPEAAKRKILGDNAARFFGLQRPA